MKLVPVVFHHFANWHYYVIGASSGIGAATAIHFASVGYRLAICGRNEQALAEVALECLKKNDKLTQDDVNALDTSSLSSVLTRVILQVLTIAGDMAVEKDCEEAVNRTIEKFKKLDVLVPSAGILVTGPLETISLEEYDRQMNINCRSVVLLMKLCVPHLVETKGNVVNVSSVTGLRAVSTFNKVVSFRLDFKNYVIVSRGTVILHEQSRCRSVDSLKRPGAGTEGSSSEFSESWRHHHAVPQTGGHVRRRLREIPRTFKDDSRSRSTWHARRSGQSDRVSRF